MTNDEILKALSEKLSGATPETLNKILEVYVNDFYAEDRADTLRELDEVKENIKEAFRNGYAIDSMEDDFASYTRLRAELNRIQREEQKLTNFVKFAVDYRSQS